MFLVSVIVGFIMSESVARINFDPTEPIQGLLRFFKFVGIWPLNCKFRPLYIIYGILFQFIFSYGYTACEVGNILYADNIHVLTEQIFVGLAEISMCIRLTNFLYHFGEVSSFLPLIKTFELRSDEERQLFKRRLSLFSSVLTFYLTCASFAITFSTVAPLFANETRLPYPGWYPLDWENDVASYWIMYLYQFIGIVFLAHTLVRLENYHIYCMICATAHIEIIAMRLSKIGYNNINISKNEEKGDQRSLQRQDQENLSSLLECITLHKLLMKFVSDIERVFSVPFLFQLFCSSLIFCFTGFQIIIMNSSSDDTILLAYYICFSATMLNEIFMPCYFGTFLTLKNESLSVGVYSSNWPDLSQAFKKTMIIFVENLKRPKIMKSGKIFTLTLFSFLTVINRSYSMFAVLRNLIK